MKIARKKRPSLITFTVESLDVPVAGTGAAAPATLGVGRAGVVQPVQVARRLLAPQRGRHGETQHIAWTKKQHVTSSCGVRYSVFMLLLLTNCRYCAGTRYYLREVNNTLYKIIRARYNVGTVYNTYGRYSTQKHYKVGAMALKNSW